MIRRASLIVTGILLLNLPGVGHACPPPVTHCPTLLASEVSTKKTIDLTAAEIVIDKTKLKRLGLDGRCESAISGQNNCINLVEQNKAFGAVNYEGTIHSCSSAAAEKARYVCQEAAYVEMVKLKLNPDGPCGDLYADRARLDQLQNSLIETRGLIAQLNCRGKLLK